MIYIFTINGYVYGTAQTLRTAKKLAKEIGWDTFSDARISRWQGRKLVEQYCSAGNGDWFLNEID